MKLPIPLWVIALGGLGSVALALGILGWVGGAEHTPLNQPGLYLSLVVLGGVLLVAETVGLVFYLRNRAAGRGR